MEHCHGGGDGSLWLLVAKHMRKAPVEEPGLGGVRGRSRSGVLVRLSEGLRADGGRAALFQMPSLVSAVRSENNVF